jgi:4-hydroxybenzoate polyprenyltransferase
LLLLIGYFSISNTLDSRILTFTVIFSSYIFFTELIHQISHRRRDMKAGIKSFPNTYGIKNSLKACQVIQLLPIFIATYLLVSDFYSNFVFIGTIIFSLLRILKVQTLNLRTTSFSKLRNRMYGSHEGLYYLALLTILKIYQHV